MGFMTLWSTKKYLVNTGKRIHMWVTRCKSNANGKTSRKVSISEEVSTDDDSRSPQYLSAICIGWGTQEAFKAKTDSWISLFILSSFIRC